MIEGTFTKEPEYNMHESNTLQHVATLFDINGQASFLLKLNVSSELGHLLMMS